MNNHFKTTAIVLKRQPFAESDLLVTLLTPEEGKITALAKGARKLTHKLCGKLEPFYFLQVEAFKGGNFTYLKEVELIKDCPVGQMDLDAQNAIYFLAELTHRLLAQDQESEEVFALWEDWMKIWLENQAKADVLLHACIIKLVTELGFMASWQHCSFSQKKLDLNQPVYLESEQVSVTQFQSGSQIPLSSALVKWVNFMQSRPLSELLQVTPSGQQKQQVWGLLQSLIYPLLSSPMKSERFLALSE